MTDSRSEQVQTRWRKCRHRDLYPLEHTTRKTSQTHMKQALENWWIVHVKPIALAGSIANKRSKLSTDPFAVCKDEDNRNHNSFQFYYGCFHTKLSTNETNKPAPPPPPTPSPPPHTQKKKEGISRNGNNGQSVKRCCYRWRAVQKAVVRRTDTNSLMAAGTQD